MPTFIADPNAFRLYCPKCAEAFHPEDRADVLSHVEDCFSAPTAIIYSTGWLTSARQKARRHSESGPGIASMPVPRPDNSVAFLDEDLLCSDAD